MAGPALIWLTFTELRPTLSLSGVTVTSPLPLALTVLLCKRPITETARSFVYRSVEADPLFSDPTLIGTSIVYGTRLSFVALPSVTISSSTLCAP